MTMGGCDEDSSLMRFEEAVMEEQVCPTTTC